MFKLYVYIYIYTYFYICINMYKHKNMSIEKIDVKFNKFSRLW